MIWTLPSEPPNPDAIARMRQHFPKPPDLMPAAWFMGGTVTFFEDLDRDTATERLCHALDELRGGITSFPKVHYVPVWKAWFRYLLPDLIIRANDPETFNNYSRNIRDKTIAAFFTIYPSEITEEYPGFREDVVSMLGTRAVPPILARDTVVDGKDNNRLFVDLWDTTDMMILFGIAAFDEASESILFCLKYLTPAQIARWVLSLFQIESPQWYLQMMISLTKWRSNSFDALIPPKHVAVFEQVIAEQFSHDLFLTWKVAILQELSVSTYNLENGSYLNKVFEETAQGFESVLFPA